MSGRPIHFEVWFRKWAAILIGAMVLTVPLVAEARVKVKCPAKPKNVVRAKRLAKKFFNKGGRFAQKERYAAALDSFLCSLKMKPHENTVYNVAQVAKFVKDQTLVKDRLERFLKKHPKHKSRPELEELIASVDGTYVPPEEGQSAPPVVAGGDPAAAEPAEGATGPPDPESDPEDIPEAEEESSPEDEEAEEVANLFAEDEAPPGQESGAEEPEPEPRPSDDGDGVPPTTIAGYVLLGTAGATLITAIGIQGATGAAKNNALDAQNYDQFTSREDKMHRLQTGATVFWIATGVLAGTGVVLILLDRDESDAGSGGVDVEIGAAPGGVVLQGRF
jgi:hypothetical protein